MSDHDDPKVTRPGAGPMRRWIAIGATVIVALILLSLLFGGGRDADPVVTDQPAATDQPAVPAPDAAPEAPAEEPAAPAGQ